MEADALSRDFDSMSEWMLNPELFKFIVEGLDFMPNIDLMATRINKQVDRFMAFRPDPDAYAIDAFAWSWEQFKFYCFPPFACISRILLKLSGENTIGILVTPDWKNQVRYSHLKGMTVNEIHLPYFPSMLLDPTGRNEEHPMLPRMKLRASLLQSRATQTRDQMLRFDKLSH